MHLRRDRRTSDKWPIKTQHFATTLPMKVSQLSSLTSSVCSADVVWCCTQAVRVIVLAVSVDNRTRAGTCNWSVHNEYCFLLEYYAV